MQRQTIEQVHNSGRPVEGNWISLVGVWKIPGNGRMIFFSKRFNDGFKIRYASGNTEQLAPDFELIRPYAD